MVVLSCPPNALELEDISATSWPSLRGIPRNCFLILPDPSGCTSRYFHTRLASQRHLRLIFKESGRFLELLMDHFLILDRFFRGFLSFFASKRLTCVFVIFGTRSLDKIFVWMQNFSQLSEFPSQSIFAEFCVDFWGLNSLNPLTFSLSLTSLALLLASLPLRFLRYVFRGLVESVTRLAVEAILPRYKVDRLRGLRQNVSTYPPSRRTRPGSVQSSGEFASL